MHGLGFIVRIALYNEILKRGGERHKLSRAAVSAARRCRAPLFDLEGATFDQQRGAVKKYKGASKPIPVACREHIRRQAI